MFFLRWKFAQIDLLDTQKANLESKPDNLLPKVKKLLLERKKSKPKFLRLKKNFLFWCLYTWSTENTEIPKTICQKPRKLPFAFLEKTLKIQFYQRKCYTPIFSKVTKTAVLTFSGMFVRLFNTSQDRREKKVWIELFWTILHKNFLHMYLQIWQLWLKFVTRSRLGNFTPNI